MQQPPNAAQAGPTARTAFSQVTLEQRDELPVLRIRNRHAEAAIALQGAQLLEYTPRNSQPIIWLSDCVEYKRGQGQRGGIPVCWPWFGAIERNPAAVRAQAQDDQLPAHGFVRTRDWTLHSVREHDDFTEVTLNFVTDSVMHSRWQHPAELQLTVTVGTTLKLELTTKNIGVQPLALTQALHTYFAVSAIDEVCISGLDDTHYVDTLDDWHDYTQNGAIKFTGETDRIYLDTPNEMHLHDNGWNRTIHLRATNSASAVVWNPWIEKSKRLSQFAPDAWREMVCIETANVLDDMVQLAPNATHTLAVEIRSENLA